MDAWVCPARRHSLGTLWAVSVFPLSFWNTTISATEFESDAPSTHSPTPVTAQEHGLGGGFLY